MEPLSPAQRLILSLVAIALMAAAAAVVQLLLADLRSSTRETVPVMLFFLSIGCAVGAFAIHRFLRLKR